MDTQMIEVLKMIWPLIIVQVSMQIFALVKLFKEGPRNLNKIWWAIIILGLNLLGPIIFLIFGVNKGEYRD